MQIGFFCLLVSFAIYIFTCHFELLAQWMLVFSPPEHFCVISYLCILEYCITISNLILCTVLLFSRDLNWYL